VLRFPWHARPALDPAAAYRFARGRGHVYVSWNGATEVVAWRLEAGASADALTAEPAVRKMGFETVLPVPFGAKWARVVALDAHGRDLRPSPTIRV
jgi:hypothetical protein